MPDLIARAYREFVVGRESAGLKVAAPDERVGLEIAEWNAQPEITAQRPRVELAEPAVTKTSAHRIVKPSQAGSSAQ